MKTGEPSAYDELYTEVSNALSHELADALRRGLRGLFGHVAVDRNLRSALPTEELVDGHSGALALDVPERHVDSAERVHEYGAVSPVRALKHCLPEVFDVVRVGTAQKWVEILVDRSNDGERPLVERAASQTVEARFVCLNTQDHEAGTRGSGRECADSRNFERLQRLAGWSACT